MSRSPFFAALAACAALILIGFVYRACTSPEDETQVTVAGAEGGAAVEAERRQGGWLARSDESASRGALEREKSRSGAPARLPGTTTRRKAAPQHAGGQRSAQDRRSPQAGSASRPASTLGTPSNKLPFPTAEARAGRTHEDSAQADLFDEPTPALEDGGELSIAGRVLNQNKEPVSGIEVIARRQSAPPNEPGSVGSGWSGNDGRYEIFGLTDGEYRVHTTPTDRYRAGHTNARAGFSSADIILEGDYEIRVVGTVTDTDGNPLGGVLVVPADRGRQTQTDRSGNYEAFMVVKWAEGTYAFQFSASGYRNEMVYLKGADIAGLQETRVDAELEPVGDTTIVNGVVQAEDGTPVGGVGVQLQSSLLRTSYQGRSAPDGRFTIADVRTGEDYRVSTIPGKGFRDYREEGIVVADGLFLDITLEFLEAGRLTGRMVDVEGIPLPRFSLWLSSKDARGQALTVTGDDSGFFAAEAVPAGPLTFSTRSAPHFAISGLTLAPGDSQEVTLVLDWGDQSIEGRVVDGSRNPAPGMRVSLTWSAGSGGLTSSSSRTTVADADGLFRFTELGPGPHQLTVVESGQGRVLERLEVLPGSRNVEVQVP